jgi:hypothetical protein
MLHRWSLDDLALLRRTYGSRADDWIAERLGCSAFDVASRAGELALAKDKRRFPGQRMPRWTEQEIERLRAAYPTRSARAIAGELGRSVKSVVSKAQVLGLRKDAQRLREMGLENVALRRDRSG